MSVFDCLRNNRTLLRCIVYIIDAALVVLAALCSFTVLTWGARFEFLTCTAFWGWLIVNVALVLILFTGLGMYSVGFSSVGMPEAMREIGRAHV